MSELPICKDQIFEEHFGIVMRMCPHNKSVTCREMLLMDECPDGKTFVNEVKKEEKVEHTFCPFLMKECVKKICAMNITITKNGKTLNCCSIALTNYINMFNNDKALDSIDQLKPDDIMTGMFE